MLNGHRDRKTGHVRSGAARMPRQRCRASGRCPYYAISGSGSARQPRQGAGHRCPQPPATGTADRQCDRLSEGLRLGVCRSGRPRRPPALEGRSDPMRARFVALIVLLLLLGAAALAANRYPWMEWLVENERELRVAIAAAPWKAVAIGFVVYFLLSLIPGLGGKSVICGWLFGFVAGVLIVDLALTLAAIVMFAVSRYWIRDAIRSRFAEQIHHIDRRFAKYGATNLLILRTAHAPYTLMNYVSGAMDVPWSTFLWTTLVGMLPGTAIFVLVGTHLPTLRELQVHGVWSLVDAK